MMSRVGESSSEEAFEGERKECGRCKSLLEKSDGSEKRLS